VYVSAAVDETVLPELAVDQPSLIVFPGAGAPLPGKVSKISWEADRQTHELIVEVAPMKLERRVALGQRADVRIELHRQERALRVPIRKIHHDESGPYVYADRGGKIALVRPKLGLTGAVHVEVLEGLSEGDVVLGAGKIGENLPVGRRWKEAS
jgi:hypothetical protein